MQPRLQAGSQCQEAVIELRTTSSTRLPLRGGSRHPEIFEHMDDDWCSTC